MMTFMCVGIARERRRFIGTRRRVTTNIKGNPQDSASREKA